MASSLSHVSARRRLVETTVYSAALAYAVGFWLVLLHHLEGGYEHAHAPLLLHWLRDASLALPAVFGAVWLATAVARRLLDADGVESRLGRAALVAGPAALGASVALGAGTPVHGLVFGGEEAYELPLLVHVARDGLLAFAVALPVAGAVAAITLPVRRAPAPAPAPAAPDARPAPDRTASAEPAPVAGPLEPRMTRRRFVRYGVVGTAGAAVWGGSAWRAYADIQNASLLSDQLDPCFTNSPVGPPFTQQLFIPPAIPPTRVTATQDVYELEESSGVAQIVPGYETPIWGYNVPGLPGITPGPTILGRKGRQILLVVRNNLPPGGDPATIIIPSHSQQDPEDHPFLASSTVVHPHGMNMDFRSDGYPEFRKEPGQQQEHLFPNNEYQRPATMWYHDHSVHITSLHIYRGLKAFYLLSDEVEDTLRLPGSPLADPGRGYGHFDVPLVIKDFMVADQEIDGRPPGTLIYDNCSHMGAYGDIMAVNTVQQPRLDVGNRKYRFRILNGSDSRQYVLALRTLANLKRDGDDEAANEPFFLIGTDQGLLPAPEVHKRFHTTPAERHELVVDFSPYPIGTRLVLVNLLINENDVKLFPIMAFDVTRTEPDLSEVPPVLRPAEHPADTEPPVRFRKFVFDRENGYWSINGLQWNPARVDARPVVDTNEEWTLVTKSGGWGHPVHLHLGRFRITEIQGRPPTPGELTGFKDSVWVGPNQTIKLVHQFWNFTGRYVFHCHNGSHEDHDMMSQFEVQPG